MSRSVSATANGYTSWLQLNRGINRIYVNKNNTSGGASAAWAGGETVTLQVTEDATQTNPVVAPVKDQNGSVVSFTSDDAIDIYCDERMSIRALIAGYVSQTFNIVRQTVHNSRF